MMRKEKEEESAESYPMKGGDGIYSYTNNSSWQREAMLDTKAMIAKVIGEHLDVSKFSANTLCIADLGCSVGPNTFIAMQNVIEALRSKYIASQVPEFLVFFNDHVSNDFNTLFASFPPEKQYLVAGVPGSFYDRLFPESSLHFVHSSFAIQWLSKVPEQLVDKNSPAFNRGRIHYYGAPDEVVGAYAAQRAKDMDKFLDARAKEMVSGGMLVATVPCIPDHIPHSRAPMGFLFDLLGSCLVELTKEGLVSEAQVDSFNIPVYGTSLGEMRKLVESNGSFSIVKMELTKARTSNVTITCRAEVEACAMHVRAGFESILSKHFGSCLMDELFDRFVEKVEEFADELKSSFNRGIQLLIVLKRN